MKKVIIGLVACCMILSGCASNSTSSRVASKREKTPTTTTVSNKEELEEIKEEYEIEKFVEVNEENEEDILETIQNYVMDHKEEIIVLSAAGIIVIEGIGFIFSTPVMIATAIAVIYGLANTEEGQEFIKVIEENETVVSIQEYFNTHDLDEIIEDALDYIDNKLDWLEQNLDCLV